MIISARAFWLSCVGRGEEEGDMDMNNIQFGGRVSATSCLVGWINKQDGECCVCTAGVDTVVSGCDGVSPSPVRP